METTAVIDRQTAHKIIKRNGVKMYEVAEAMELTPTVLSALLRKPLKDGMATQFMAAVKAAVQAKEAVYDEI